jgi:hypothetical protein
MGQKTSRLIRMVVISPECAAVVAGINVAYWWPAFTEKIGNLFLEPGLLEYCAMGLPLGGLYFAYNTGKHVLHPTKAEEKGVYQWGEYTLLRYHVYFTLSLCIMGVIASVLLLLYRDVFTERVLGSIYGITTCTWFVSVITLVMARLKIPAVLGGEGGPSLREGRPLKRKGKSQKVIRSQVTGSYGQKVCAPER